MGTVGDLQRISEEYEREGASWRRGRSQKSLVKELSRGRLALKMDCIKKDGRGGVSDRH